ncbi:glutamate ABC transporter substrate-binding protein [Streptomyces sp. DSM 44917]|uniref:Glutamate ABC transporter substrate-binding protein n=1 Tax=Streptomyces boetiae TaxID=3075541 RepID=A0ABU2L281_9ACTN|nr:glutamate ABC transporter substrate-binding protein [Streptomyces sp. DSM 44917]MDT0305607.1 glutamate ABC transporter substrate-binding protein [Streptomyces sp. DSM 44917]
MRLRKATTLAAPVLVLALAATACGGGGDGDGDGGITIGIKYDQPGVGLRDADGEFSGFDVDVATYIAGELGYEPEEITWQEAPSADRENMLRRGDVDMIVASYSITAERADQVAFAGPYFLAHQDLLIRTDAEAPTEEGIGDLTLCSVGGSTSAQRMEEEYGANLQNFQTYSECLDGIVGGSLDALTTDDAILAGYAAQDEYAGELALAGLNLSDEFYGVGLPLDSDRVDAVNEAITQMVDDGSWDRFVEENFGPSGYEPEAAPAIGSGPTAE